MYSPTISPIKKFNHQEFKTKIEQLILQKNTLHKDSKLSEDKITELEELVESILEDKISDEEALELLDLVNNNFYDELNQLSKQQNPSEHQQKSSENLDYILQSSETVSKIDKLKKVIVASLVQAKESGFDTSSKTSILYTDPSHDIDDPLEISKKIIASVFFGGKLVIRVSGHNPNASIKMHEDLYREINRIKDQLLLEILSSKTLSQDFKDFVRINCQGREHNIKFIPYLETTDLSQPGMAVGRKDFFGKDLKKTYLDRLYTLKAKKSPQDIASLNIHFFQEAYSFLQSFSKGNTRSLEVSVISKIDKDEVDRLVRFVENPSYRSKELITQGSNIQSSDDSSKTTPSDYNLKLLDQTTYDHLVRVFNKVVNCGSDLAKGYGLGKVFPSSVDKSSFMYEVLSDLVESYEVSKQDAWLLSGMPIKISGDDFEAYNDRSLGLSFLGILALNKIGFPAVNYPAVTVSNGTDFGSVVMSPLRFLGEHLFQDHDGEKKPTKIKKSDSSLQVEFSHEQQKKVARVFCQFYKHSEQKILQSFWSSLDDTQKNAITHSDPVLPFQTLDLDFIKEKLGIFFRSTTLDQLKKAIAEKLTTAIKTQYAQEDPIKFYKGILSEFVRDNPNFSRPSIAYDTSVSAIASLVFKDDELHGFLLELQDEFLGRSGPSGLVIDQNFLTKLKTHVDKTGVNPKIKEFFDQITRLKDTLNDPLLEPQKVVDKTLKKEAVMDSSEQPRENYASAEDVNFLYSSLNINGKIYLPIYSKDRHYREIPNNDLAKFIAESQDKPKAGYYYLPYFDENNQARLLEVHKDHHQLLNPNEYQVNIFSSLSQPFQSYIYQARHQSYETSNPNQYQQTGYPEIHFPVDYQRGESPVYAPNGQPIASFEANISFNSSSQQPYYETQPSYAPYSTYPFQGGYQQVGVSQIPQPFPWQQFYEPQQSYAPSSAYPFSNYQQQVPSQIPLTYHEVPTYMFQSPSYVADRRYNGYNQQIPSYNPNNSSHQQSGMYGYVPSCLAPLTNFNLVQSPPSVMIDGISRRELRKLENDRGAKAVITNT